jgi:hypothetical protein
MLRSRVAEQEVLHVLDRPKPAFSNLNMKVEYSKHIEARLRLRGIAHELPKQVFEEAIERYSDTETGHLVAVMSKRLYDRNREVMVAYVIHEDLATLLTIHPLKNGQKGSRIRSGRWRKIE